MIFSVLLAFTLITTSTARAGTMTIPEGERTLYVTDVIQGKAGILLSDKILTLSTTSSDDIHIIINSPGGSVRVGYAIVAAMERARSRGVTFHCSVTGMAASMAFQILAHCDKRYALPYSALLWHPVRVVLGGGLFSSGAVITPDEAERLLKDLRAAEQMMVPKLLSVLDLPEDVFYYHYINESWHYAITLSAMSPHFLTVVEDYEGIPTKVWTGGGKLSRFLELDEEIIPMQWELDYTTHTLPQGE